MAKPKELFTCYVNNGADYCARILGGNPSDYKAKIENIVKSRIQHPKVQYEEVVRPGQIEQQETTLWAFTTKYSDKVITPSGSVYMPADEHQAMIPDMLKDLVSERDVFKGKQLIAKAAGRKREASQFKSKQTSNKIFANAVPGGMGSEYCLFFDLGGYNAVTSAGRMLIASSYTLEEQLLYGNFQFENPRAVVNHLILLTRHMPPAEQIFRTMSMFRMKQPTKQQLIDWLLKCMSVYGRFSIAEQTPIHQFVNTMNEAEVAFVYYYQNLDHIIWEHASFFKGLLARLFDTEQYPERECPPSMINQIDKDLITALTIQLCNTTILNGIKPSDLAEKAPEKLSRFLSIASGMQERIGKMQLIFDTFVNIPIVYPNLNRRKNMLRKSTVLSDTDSIIFTLLKWVTWYTDRYGVTTEAYQILSLVIYWLTKSIAPVLFNYSVSRGATGDGRYIMRMKNEFLYLALELFEQKKHYAGIYSVQEGYILPEPVIDIKGVNLKGSTMCVESRDFAETFVNEYILLPAAHEELSPSAIIGTVVNRENEIRDSIERGETTFCKMGSIRLGEEYDENAGTNSYQYIIAWNEVFGDKYGAVQPPGKFTIVEVAEKLKEDYLNSLEKDIRDKMLAYKEKYGKFPKYYALNPMINKIPEELISILDIRTLIHHNVKPLHMMLEGLNLCLGMRDRNLLFSDIYGRA